MKNLWISVRITLAMCVVLTVGYVLLLRLTSAVVSPNDGEAALVELDGKVVGAANVGQAFTDSVYFWGRPSAVEYNGGGSGGSNKGTNNPEYLSEVESRIESFMRLIRIYRGGTFPLSWLRRAVRVSIPTFRYEGPRFRFVGWRLRGACRRTTCVRSSKRALSVLGWVFSGLTRSMF